jgi:hypothetical protein
MEVQFKVFGLLWKLINPLPKDLIWRIHGPNFSCSRFGRYALTLAAKIDLLLLARYEALNQRHCYFHQLKGGML